MDDLWFINAFIPLKNAPLVEIVRGVVLWCVWLEKNKLCFQNTCVPSLSSVGTKIISLVDFWCKTLLSSSLLHLSLILPLDTNHLHTQELIPLPSEGEEIIT